MRGRDVTVPGDPSSAAFVAAAALIVPGSDVTIEGVLINPTRTGFYLTLREMGGNVHFLNEREEGGELVADIRVRFSRAEGRRRCRPSARPSMIDEYPVLAVVAAFAEGTTRMEGLAELKVKESDRLAAIIAGLAANGIAAEVRRRHVDRGGVARVRGGGTVATHLDHRIAMAFLTLGLAAEQAGRRSTTSRWWRRAFPSSRALMESIGASFERARPHDSSPSTDRRHPARARSPSSSRSIWGSRASTPGSSIVRSHATSERAVSPDRRLGGARGGAQPRSRNAR